jgi:hypothetical protein
VHSRRARPTLRLIEEDLTAGWESPVTPREMVYEMTTSGSISI